MMFPSTHPLYFELALTRDHSEIHFTLLGDQSALTISRYCLIGVFDRKKIDFKDNGSDLYVNIRYFKTPEEIEALFDEITPLTESSVSEAAPSPKRQRLSSLHYRYNPSAVRTEENERTISQLNTKLTPLLQEGFRISTELKRLTEEKKSTLKELKDKSKKRAPIETMRLIDREKMLYEQICSLQKTLGELNKQKAAIESDLDKAREVPMISARIRISDALAQAQKTLPPETTTTPAMTHS